MSQFEAAAGGRAYSIPNSQSNMQPNEKQMMEFYKQNNIVKDFSDASQSILSYENKTMKSKESIRVCVRVRPVLPHERSRGEVIYYPIQSGNEDLEVSSEQFIEFQAIKVADGQNLIESKYDKVFRQTSAQSEIYMFVKGKNFVRKIFRMRQRCNERLQLHYICIWSNWLR